MLTQRTFAAFLFDMDGTLVDSIGSANRAWTRWAEGHGIDPDTVLRTMHGVRAVETIRRHLPQGDVERELAILTRAEMEDMDGVLELAGAAAFLRSLPPERWAIVTSAPRGLALARLDRHSLPDPAHADRAIAAFLFDMDGTLVDSIGSANRAWTRWAEGHGIDPDTVLRTMHGVRAVETIRRHLPQGDVERELAILTRAEMEDMDGVLELAGAAAFLRSLPPERWAIVTSAPRGLALARLDRAGIPVPPVRSPPRT
ncbi:MAG: hypothetical protein U1E53_33145 [Dongiaceae bacterium]